MWNPLAPGALDQIKPALEAGLQGVCLFPAMHRYSMHDDRVQQMLSIVAGNQAGVVFVHCGVLTVGVRKKLGLPSQFDMRFSNPIDVHASALAFPKLPFVIPHFGAGYFREALMVADLCPNVYFDTSSTNLWMKYEGLTLRSVFERALAVLGPQRLLFGSDSSFFPRGWVADVFETQAAVLNELRVPQGDAAGIFGGNLRRLLNRTNPS
jgi:predicted TIM-barrel fold metal-dependent hydrolase